MSVLFLLLNACFPSETQAKPAPTPDVAPTMTTSVDTTRLEQDLAWARAMNGPNAPRPPAAFRAGHVTPRAFSKEAIKVSDGRFEIQFPSGAPITTPAVHQGRIFSSGGFHGKEFYAFDAHTGAFAWGRDLDDDGPSAPACEAGVCVFNTESCTIFALNAQTGEQLWSWWMGDPMLAAPSIADGIVYTSYPASGNIGSGGVDNLNTPQNIMPTQTAASGGGGAPEGASHVLAALDLKTGKIQWQKWIDGDVISAPVISDGEVHITTFTGTMFTFAAKSGEIKAAERGRATSSPTIAGGRIFWSQRSEAEGQAARESLAGTNKQDRKSRVLANERDAPYLDATVQAQTGYAAQGQSLDASNGFAGGAPASANAGLAMGNVGQGSVSRLQAYQGSKIIHAFDNNYASMGDEIVSTDPTTGEKRWSIKLEGDLRSAGGFLAAPPVVAGTSLMVATLAGDVLLLDPNTGQRQRQISIGAPIRSQPIVEKGWLYVGTEDGRLIGVDTGDPALTGWPMWGGDPARSGA